MHKFQFLNNAYWTINEDYNACYIRTVGREFAEAIIEKYNKITLDSRWNSETILVNDYEDITGVSLSTKDIIDITNFHESILPRLGAANWYFITSNNMFYYGIIRMYSIYVNYFNGPRIIALRNINSIKLKQILTFALNSRWHSRAQEEIEINKRR